MQVEINDNNTKTVAIILEYRREKSIVGLATTYKMIVENGQLIFSQFILTRILVFRICHSRSPSISNRNDHILARYSVRTDLYQLCINEL